MHKFKIGCTFFCKALLCLLKCAIVVLPFGFLWNWIKFPENFLEPIRPSNVFDSISLYCFDHGYWEAAWTWRDLAVESQNWLNPQIASFLLTELLLIVAVVGVYLIAPMQKMTKTRLTHSPIWNFIQLLFYTLLVFSVPFGVSVAILLIYYGIFSEYAPQVWHVIILIPAVVGAIGAVLWVIALSLGFALRSNPNKPNKFFENH